MVHGPRKRTMSGRASVLLHAATARNAEREMRARDRVIGFMTLLAGNLTPTLGRHATTGHTNVAANGKNAP